jgi:hypothetical protein
MSFSQKRDRNYKNSGHLSIEKSFDSGSPEKRKIIKNKKISLNIKTKAPNLRPTTASSSEIMLLNRKSKFSYENNETFPESTKSVLNEKYVLNLEPVIFS